MPLFAIFLQRLWIIFNLIIIQISIILTTFPCSSCLICTRWWLSVDMSVGILRQLRLVVALCGILVVFVVVIIVIAKEAVLLLLGFLLFLEHDLFLDLPLAAVLFVEGISQVGELHSDH